MATGLCWRLEEICLELEFKIDLGLQLPCQLMSGVKSPRVQIPVANFQGVAQG